MVQAIIFDVDGTLVDSVDLHARAWREAFRDFGHEVEFDAVRSQIGKGGDQLLPVFLTEHEIATEGQALERHRGAVLRDRYLGQIKPFPGVRALFERLRADGKQIALASSAKSDELAHYKDVAHIGDLIDAQTTSDDAEKTKPHPDIFLAALERLHDLPPGDALVVGDTPYDVVAASRAGIRAIGLLCGGFSEASLREAGCIAIYENPADLLIRYDGSPIGGSA